MIVLQALAASLPIMLIYLCITYPDMEIDAKRGNWKD
jgi:hypothetical protein